MAREHFEEHIEIRFPNPSLIQPSNTSPAAVAIHPPLPIAYNAINAVAAFTAARNPFSGPVPLPRPRMHATCSSNI